MLIHSIYIEHFLSFDKFVWEGLDPHLNVVVGPNGVGKTNLFHAFEAVCNVLRPERTQDTSRWTHAEHQGTDADTMSIALDLQFTAEWEQRLLCAFLAAVLCDQQQMQQTVTAATSRNLNPDSLRRFALWVQEQLLPENISWFFHGRLTIAYAGRGGWQCIYEALPGQPEFRLDLTGGGTLTGHADHNPQITTQNWGSLFVAWRSSLTEQERTRLDNCLTGATAEVSFPVPDLSHLPDWVSSQQGIALQIVDQMQIVDPTTLAPRRTLTSMADISLEPGRLFGIRSVFQRLLERALVFSDNVRLSPQHLFIARDLLTQPIDLSSGEELARFLFCKKNGNFQDREQYRAVQELFHRMTGRRFEVVLGSADSGESQLEQPFSQQHGGLTPEQQSDVSLDLVTSGPRDDILLEFSGAGIAEALFLSAVLAGSTGQVVLLDEPALNLHPTMQTMLLNEIQALAHQPEGKRSQFLVNTHSPALVPPDLIECVSRFTLQEGHTIRQALKIGQGDQDCNLDAEQINQSDLVKLRNLLRADIAARGLLFSRAVLLVEGETELGALPVWCPALVNQDIALYVVGGKGEFVSPLRLIQSFAIPWAILADGEVLWDLKEQKRSSPLNHIDAILAVCHHIRPSVPGNPGSNAEDFVQWRKTLEVYGIFTLARSAREGFEKAVRLEIKSELWAEAETRFGKNKVAVGRFVAENSSCPENVTGLMRKVLLHLHKQDASIHVPDGDLSQLSAAQPGG